MHLEAHTPLIPYFEIRLHLEMNNVHHDVAALIDQHHMSADDHVRASDRRRGQTPFDFLRAWHHLLAQPRRQRAAHS